MFEVIFDVETKKFFNDTGTNDPADLGVSIVSLYTREVGKEGKMMSFWEEQFDDMWKIFLNADRIIGFNTVRFDVPALKPYAPSQFSKLPHFDILKKLKEICGKSASLNAIAKDTLGKVKIDSGSNATKYWEKHDEKSLKTLKKYCEADVAITRDIYDFALQNKYLKFTDFWNTPNQIDVDFSYEKIINPTKQTSLF